MSEWKSANMGAFIPEGLGDVLSTTSGVVESVVGILEAIQATVDAIRNFIIPIPGADLASVLIFAVEQFKESILTTGMSMLNMWDYPMIQFYRTGVVGDSFQNSFERDTINAFIDTSDPNLPEYTGDSAALVLVTGAPGLANIYPLVDAIKDAFSWWQELKEVQEQMDRLAGEIGVQEVLAAMARGDIKLNDNPSKQTQEMLTLKRALDRQRNMSYADYVQVKPLIPSVSTPASQIEQEIIDYIAEVNRLTVFAEYPNWQGTSLQQVVKPLPDLLNQVFDPLIASLQSGRSILDTLDSYIETVGAKIDLLVDIANTISTYIAQLEGLVNATGFYALFVASPNGMEGLAGEIAAADDKPFDGLRNGFYSGFTIIGGGPSLSAFVALFSPIGAG